MSSSPEGQPGGAAREVLHRYLAALRGGELFYADAFAGAAYRTPPRTPAEAHPTAALFEALAPGAGVVLLEEDPGKVEWLRRALRLAGRQEGEHAGTGPEPPGPGEIRVLEGALEATAALAGWAAQAARSLLYLAPPAPGKLPLASARELLAAGPGTDLLIRFPADDLRRLARHGGSTLADLPPTARRVLEGYSRLFGDARHEWVFLWRAAREREGDEAAELRLLEHYTERLRQEAGERTLKAAAVSPVVGGPREYLLLAAGEPARALQLNAALFAARSDGLLAWPEEPEDGMVRYRPSGVLELFGAAGSGAAPAGAMLREVDTTALAHRLATRHLGKTLPLRALLADLAPTDLFWDDVRRALAGLRREGRALYRSLADPAAPVAFPRGAAHPPRRAGRGRRGGADELSLLQDEAGEQPS